MNQTNDQQVAEILARGIARLRAVGIANESTPADELKPAPSDISSGEQGNEPEEEASR